MTEQTLEHTQGIELTLIMCSALEPPSGPVMGGLSQAALDVAGPLLFALPVLCSR